MLSGKKVPEKRNIGVINRKIGKLRVSIVGTTDVQTIPTQAKAQPPRKATGRRSRACGKCNRPKQDMMIIMSAVPITDLVAPQRISPVMISSIVNGVASIASNVF